MIRSGLGADMERLGEEKENVVKLEYPRNESSLLKMVMSER